LKCQETEKHTAGFRSVFSDTAIEIKLNANLTMIVIVKKCFYHAD